MPGSLGVLLAGGRGERLGAGTPKALVALHGATLLERALAQLRAVCARIVVVAPAALALPVPPGASAVHDPGEGPLVALSLALSANEFRIACVLGVDFPLVSPGLLQGLERQLQPPALAAMPRRDGVLQPLVAVYGAGASPILAEAVRAGERSLVRAAARLEPRIVEGELLRSLGGDERRLLNVNTREDLEEAARRLPTGGNG